MFCSTDICLSVEYGIHRGIMAAGEVVFAEKSVDIVYAIIFEISNRKDIPCGCGLLDKGHLLPFHIFSVSYLAVFAHKDIAPVLCRPVKVDRSGKWDNPEFLNSQRAGKRSEKCAVHLLCSEAVDDVAVPAEDAYVYLYAGLLGEVFSQGIEPLHLFEDIQFGYQSNEDLLLRLCSR